ncbi:ABC transporter substrate-binding protein [Hahella sp. CR1]|uniref:ABC transporter substrate-binding protein n=1 Tax=Hahella sp. CR1 TaxID=2992807 RepID=UPI0024413EEB|nr:ABC transporter substrate-binding protein [Hahella sp. CR1]MDG9666301.1 ABC transporter substrate-binding protein [Hahella sp. CR1]
MKKTIINAIGTGVFLSAAFSLQAHAETLTISCGAVGAELELCKEGVKAWAEKTGNEVKVVSTPNSSSERLALYQQLLAAGSQDIDIFQIDVVWPGMLGQYFVDLKPFSNGAEKDHFESIVNNNTVDGKLVAMPWFTDAGVLYYRKDLLEKYNQQPPETWAQLEASAKMVQEGERKAGNDKMWGFVWQGRAYEGLTCNATEWVASFNGGTVVDEKGKITINNPQAAKALNTAAGWIGTISPQGVTNYAEEESRGVFQSGNAVFMRNWPYAWSLAQAEDSAIKGKVGVVALPKGDEDGRHSATLGGWQLAVSKYAKNPKLSADLVMYLTSYEEQKRRAIKASYNPTINALYKDKDVLAATPFFGSLYETFVSGVPRPSSVTKSKYNQVSTAFFNAVHSVVSGKEKAEASLAQLEGQLRRFARNGKWK